MTNFNKAADTVERALREGAINDDHPLYILIGKHITGVFRSADNAWLRFTLDSENDICIYVDNECCSSSWFESINNADDLVDAYVSFILEKSNVAWPGCNEVEDKVYGYMLATSKGFVDLIFLNSSNGYYGGSIRRGSSSAHPTNIPVAGDWRA